VASAEPIAVELAAGPGASARIEWDPGRLRGLADPGSATGCWRLDGEPDWSAVSTLRVVSAAFEDGRLLALAAIRPIGAEGHGDESVAGLIVQPDVPVTELASALISVEYDSEGVPQRIGLELYPDDDGAPLRAAGDRAPEGVERGEGSYVVPMAFRLEGMPGVGLLEFLSRS
jgi:hypothetical protein